MALNPICQFKLPTNANGLSGDFIAGRVVKTFYDDSDDSIKVYVYTATGTEVGLQTSGPTLSTTGGRGRSFELRNFSYKFCDGTTLRSFFHNNDPGGSDIYLVFPYCYEVTQNNHWSCAILVCDINFNLQDTEVTEDSGASDGSIEVSSSSSLSDVQFSLDSEVQYGSGFGSDTYTFTDLAAGSYTVYAVDSNQCKVSINVIVPAQAAVYGTRWRLEFNDIKKTEAATNRVDIEELEYSGAITEVKGAADPFIVSWRGESNEDIFSPVIPSESVINLISESDFQFVDIFTGDDRKYRVTWYQDQSSGFVQKWQGYVVPMLYSEPYVDKVNYPVSITATDQLANLNDIDFTDDFGNTINQRISVLDAICIILRKTDISINLFESVNIYDSGMDSDPEDSAIQQAFIDTASYLDKDGLPDDCREVLEKLLLSLGARVYQADGLWRVELVEEKAATVNYRIFNLTSEIQSNGTIRSLANIETGTDEERLVLRDRSGVIEITPFYNKIIFAVDTKFKNNLLTSGDFEQVDLVGDRFKGWGFDLTNGNGIAYGLENLKEDRRESKSALYVDFQNAPGASEIVIEHEEFNIASITAVVLSFKLDVFFRPLYENFYSYIDVAIKIGDHYAVYKNAYMRNDTTDSATDYLLDSEYQRIYVDDPLKWNTVEIKMIPYSRRVGNPQVREIVGPLTLKIRVGNNPKVDFASIALLRDYVTDSNAVQNQRNRVRVLDGDTIREYVLERGTKADDSPDVIRPDDYDGSTNPYIWILKNSFKDVDEDYLMNSLLIDNVSLSLDADFEEDIALFRRYASAASYYNQNPKEILTDVGEEDLESLVIYEDSFNPNVKIDFPRDLIHTDYTIKEIEGVDDENYIRLTKAWFSLQDGTPTDLWSRGYNTETKPIIEILMEMYQAQITTPAYKLTGTFLTDIYPSYFNAFYESYLEKFFIPAYLSVNVKQNTIQGELLELKTGDDGESPNPDVYEFTDEYTTEFNA